MAHVVCGDDGRGRVAGGESERVLEGTVAVLVAKRPAVDVVVLFDEDTPLELIRLLKPSVLVKGGDYTVETVVGHEDMIASGGRVEIVPTVKGFSTTNIMQRLMAPDAG